jgi:thymidylate synthase (FAD)
MQVRLISATALSDGQAALLPPELHTVEGIMAYTARVSSPHQDNPTYAKLLKYCAEHGHWSVFEMVDMTVEITTSRAIAQQILRHRSFCFQEFSQRYAKASMGFEVYEARRQDTKNRQNSIDDLDGETKAWFHQSQKALQVFSESLYEQALEKGIAKEQARFLLPASTTTKLYMKGSVRSWIHYLNVRTDPSTQKEHREVALAIKEVFLTQFPITSEALGWSTK